MPLSGVAASIGRNSFDPPAPVVPCFDVHARELDLHDSGSDASGILAFDGEASHLILNPSMSGAAPICTAFFFDAYNSGGLAILNLFNGIGTVVDIDTVRTEFTDAFDIVGSPGEVHVWTSGTYEITYRATGSDNAGTNRHNVRAWLEHSSAGGSFVEVPGSRAYTYMQTTTADLVTIMCTVIVENVAPGDQFRLKMAETSTGVTSPFGPRYATEGCSLTLEKLE